MLPLTLNRLQYFVRWVLWMVVIILLGAGLIPLVKQAGGDPLLVMVGVGLGWLLLRILYLDLPRVRSIGWSPWALVLLPITGGIMQLLLFFMPPKESVPLDR